MLNLIADFLLELPSALRFGAVVVIAILLAVFIPSVLTRICSIFNALFTRNDGSEDDLSPVPSSNSISNPRPKRRKRNAFKRLYSNIVQNDSSSNEENNGTSTPSSGSGSRRKRRHSASGAFHFARKAKDFIRGHTYNRKYSEAFRGSLPKPPTEFFTPLDYPGITPGLSEELYFTKSNLSMLELPDEIALNQEDIEVRMYNTDDVIVKPGDQDNCAYIVIEGCLTAYITPCETKDIAVKRIEAGNGFYSLLSLLDILMKVPSKFKTVSLRAAEPSRVAIFSFNRFHTDFQKRPDLWTRPIQIILTRMLHVTLTTLHNQMGLGQQLLKKKMEDRQDDRNRQISGNSLRRRDHPARLRQRRLSSSDAHVENTRRQRWAQQPQQMSIDETSSSVYTPNVSLMRRKIISMAIPEDQNEFQNLAVKWFGEALGLNNTDSHDLLHSRVIINSLDEGRLINEQGSTDNPQLILVLKGSLKITQDAYDDDEGEDAPDVLLTLIHPREIVGGLQLLTNEPCFYTISANVATLVAVLNTTAFAEIVALRPQVCLPVAFSVLRRLSTFVRAVDFAIDWVLLDSGQSVYRQDDPADSMFVVLSGRLRSVDKKVAIEEFGRGDSLGMIEVLQRKPRATTVLAVRYSQLARIPEGLLTFVKMQFPQVGFRLVRLLGQFYSDSRRAHNLLPMPLESSTAPDPISQVKNLHTIAIMPASLDVPLSAFTCELYHVLSASTRVLRLSSKKIADTLGESVLEKQADFQLMHWLNAQEDGYSLIIYETDYTSTNWTRRCLRQADTILVIGLGNEKPPKRQMIEDHLNMNQDGIRTTKKLVLLWKEETEHPENTYEWLKGSWFSGHYHLKAANRMFQWNWKSGEKEIVNYYEDSVFPNKIDFNSDFSRLGRILTGNAVGLVLGGGGARGAAHIGIIRALKENGIPIDIVGGTSIGSMVGGVFAENPRADYEKRAASWFKSMGSLWAKIWDLTYSYTAMFTGAGFNKTLRDLFDEKDIEDLWLPYFCVTTDISTSEMRVHRSGSLWAYVRASMSLAGYLPPLCDPADGHHLLDGGYVNNLPADVMRNMGARCVIAVDVGSVAETDLYNYGDSLSGIWIILNKLNPWGQAVKILDMQEIQSRLAFVSCVRQLELVKKAPYCHYLRPPIDSYQTLEFDKFDLISKLGYEYGLEKIADLVQHNENVKSVMNPDTLRTLTKRRGRNRERAHSMRNSFTDLAAQISRIPNKLKFNGSMTDISVFDENWDDESTDDMESYDDMSEEEEGLEMNTDYETRTTTPRISE